MPTITDIINETYSLTDSDVTSYPAATMLRRINLGVEKVAGKLLSFDMRWEWDDSNYTDFPRGTTTMVAGQHDYRFDTSHLAIESVQVLDNEGIWHFLSPINKDEMGVPVEEFEKTDGLPWCYDKDGQSVLIYPAPSAAKTTLIAGLQVHFRRTADIFTSAQVTTGTKVPGFASPFHYILSYEAAIPFCLLYKKDRVALLEKKLAEMYEDMEKFYCKREKDERDILTMKGISFR